MLEHKPVAARPFDRLDEIAESRPHERVLTLFVQKAPLDGVTYDPVPVEADQPAQRIANEDHVIVGAERRKEIAVDHIAGDRCQRGGVDAGSLQELALHGGGRTLRAGDRDEALVAIGDEIVSHLGTLVSGLVNRIYCAPVG